MSATRPRRPGPTVRTRVTELRAGEPPRHHEDRLATEEPLELRLAWPGSPAERVWLTMRTPGHDFELAAGWLVHEGLADPGELERVAYCTDADLRPEQEFNVVTVTLRRPPARPLPERLGGFGAGSACGVCGKDSVTAAMDVPYGPRWQGPEPEPDVVRSLPDRLRASQQVFDRTGGVHAAGLATAEGEMLVVREDVGRHNAVDKVTGSRALAGRPTAEAVLVLSGRIGFELAAKAVSAGIGTVVAVGAPTSLAVQLAEDAGVHLYGFTGPERTVRHC